MTPLQALAVAAAGVGAGAINAMVGSGTLITFPALLGVGLPPVTANVSNTVGLVPGSLAGALGYRRELAGQRDRLLRLGTLSVAGGLAGAILLLTLPAAAFRAIVPALIALACVLVIVQPRLSAALRRRAAAPVPTGSALTGSAVTGPAVTGPAASAPAPAYPPSSRRRRGSGGPLLHAGVLAAGTYGGYFGAAQGVLLIGVMGLLLDEELQRLNAAKNVLAGLVNATAAVLFVFVAEIAWDAVALIAIGSVAGGLLGARIGRRLPDGLLRGVVVAVGLVAIWRVLTTA